MPGAEIWWLFHTSELEGQWPEGTTKPPGMYKEIDLKALKCEQSRLATSRVHVYLSPFCAAAG